ncbi:unnamed protein product [Strongylus vulgaris]|uniref:S1 motif domain-containing protein n=1 Tax=Strongylus vulgaris TaxID=40348 RepID=A0A3P7KDC4_STRVU|nr:unnamed protein product [Strongylus vulgaris]
MQDATPGEIINAKVTDVHPRGLQVSICDNVKGFIPVDLASDRVVALEKTFTVGSFLKCKVWFVNDEKKQIWLTARHSLVNYKGVAITSYDPKYEGVISVGVVVKILSTGGALIQFFATVRGLLRAGEAKRLGSELKLGQVVEVQVMEVDPTERRMSLGLVEECSQSTAGHVLHPKNVDFGMDDNTVFAAIVDEVSESSVPGHKSERVMVHLESDPSIKGCLQPNFISDSLNSPLESGKGVFRRGMKLNSIAALGNLGGMNRFTSKRFVCAWLQNSRNNVPKSFDDLKQGQVRF